MSRENEQNYNTLKATRPRPLARPSELLVLLLLLGLLTGLYYRRPRSEAEPQRAAIYRDDQLVLALDLRDPGSPGTYELREEPGIVVEVSRDRAVRVQASPCPDKLCVRTGWLRHPGEQAICLPLKIIVKLEGPSSEETDDEGFDVVLGDGAYDPYLNESEDVDEAGSAQPDEEGERSERDVKEGAPDER